MIGTLLGIVAGLAILDTLFGNPLPKSKTYSNN